MKSYQLLLKSKYCNICQLHFDATSICFLLAYVIISNICNIFYLKSGVIKAFGSEKEVASVLKACHFETIYDADGGCVIPGLIDGHTHPVWAGDRVHEFAMKVSFNIFYLYWP